MWFWVVGKHEGKTHLYGPCNSEERAYEIGSDKFIGDFEVVQLPTRNSSRATQMVKAKKLVKYDIEEATKKFKHPKQEKEDPIETFDDIEKEYLS